MKSAIHLLLIAALTAGPIGCDRANAPDQPVSANTQNAERSETAQPTRDTRTAEKKSLPPRESARESRVDRKTQRTETESRPAPAPRARATETVASGTPIRVTLATGINTDNNNEGDEFTAHLSQALVVDGKVVANKGDQVTGHINKIEEPGRVKGRARLELVLDKIQTSGKTYRISTEPFIAVASDNHKRDTAEIAGGAAVGTAIGAIAGGKKGAAIGAIIGGGTGTTAVLLTKGQHLELEPETKVNFVLSRDLDLPVIRSSST